MAARDVLGLMGNALPNIQNNQGKAYWPGDPIVPQYVVSVYAADYIDRVIGELVARVQQLEDDVTRLKSDNS